MKCPYCGALDSQVLESRAADDGLRRRRKCVKCKKRFTTYEKPQKTVLWVVKKDGRREPFDRQKVKEGILRAIHKRNVSLEQVEDLVDRVEREILKKEKQEILGKVIGTTILRKLKKIDRVAWLRFASVYLEFEDLSDFEKAIESS